MLQSIGYPLGPHWSVGKSVGSVGKPVGGAEKSHSKNVMCQAVEKPRPLFDIRKILNVFPVESTKKSLESIGVGKIDNPL